MTAFRIVIAAFVGLWSVSAFAQIPPATNNPNGPDQQGQTATDPNAMKDGSQTNAGEAQAPPGSPDIVEDTNATPEQKASAEYSGPAVLSRAISASEPMNPTNTKFTPSVGLEYLYGSGLTGVTLGTNGQLPNANSSGVQLSYSLAGTKLYKKDIFRLSFNGFLYDYFQNSAYNGSSDTLTLTWRHMLSRHLSFGVVTSAQTFNQNSLLLSGAEYINSGVGTTLITATPETQAFDGRVYTYSTQGNVTYQMTQRLSIDLSGGGFLTRLASTSLYGDTGYQAGADIAYRITRHVTTGVYYSYTHFDFIGIFGATDINTVGLTYSIAFNPTTQLITRLGGSRLENSGITSVTLNPLLSLLFGTTAVQAASYQTSYTPDIDAQLRHKVSNLSLSLAYARGVTPGNGIILTSIRQTGSFGVDYKLGRNWSLHSTGGYDALRGVGTVVNESYTSLYYDASVYRKIYRNVDWHARVDYHHYLFNNTYFLRNTFLVSTGFVWSPGNLLERVW